MLIDASIALSVGQVIYCHHNSCKNIKEFNSGCGLTKNVTVVGEARNDCYKK